MKTKIIVLIGGLLGALAGYFVGCKMLEYSTEIRTEDLFSSYVALPVFGFFAGALIILAIVSDE